jgi:hypothetical protein
MTESEIQKQVFAHIRQRPEPGVFCFHVPNHKGARRAAGFTAGVPDVVCIRQGAIYALELKTESGRPSEKQLLAVDNIRNAGGFAAVCHGLDRALACLETWGILRKAA